MTIWHDAQSLRESIIDSFVVYGHAHVNGDATAHCFPFSNAEVAVAMWTWVFFHWQPLAFRQCWWHICGVDAEWSHTTVQHNFPGLEQMSKPLEGFCVAAKATVGCTEEGQTEWERMPGKMRPNAMREGIVLDQPMQRNCSRYCWHASHVSLLQIFTWSSHWQVLQVKVIRGNWLMGEKYL